MRKRIMAVMLLATMIMAVIPMAFATQSRSDSFSRNYTLTGNGADDIVSVATAQLGKTGYQLGYTEGWCADFVSDCAKLANISTSVVPFTGGPGDMYNKLMNSGGQIVSSPAKGDIVFYINSSGFCHVAIMCDSTYAINGNYSSQVMKITYSSYTNYEDPAREIRIVRPNYINVPSPTIPDGIYAFSNKYSGKYMSAYKDSSQGNNVFISYRSMNSPEYEPDQLWKVTYSNGYYQIVNLSRNMALDVAGGVGEAEKSGANIQLWTINWTDAQKWSIVDCGDGYYKIVSKYSNLPLDVSDGALVDGANIQQWIDNGTDVQRWTLTKISDSMANIPNGLYVFQNKYSGKLMTADSTSSSNVYINQSDGNNAKYASNQVWQITRKSDNYYEIRNVYRNMALDVAGGVGEAEKSGANIWVFTPNYTNAQKWGIYACDNGYYKIVSKYSGLPLDVSDGAIVDGANIQQWIDNGTDVQRWTIIPLPESAEIVEPISIHNHKMTYIPAQAATCTAHGNTEYWTCADCDKYFSDVAGTNEITQASTVIKALGHSYENGVCTRCGEKDPNHGNPQPAPATPEVHFPRVNTYQEGQFTDVPPEQWFTPTVAGAVELGLMKGDSKTTFNPYGDVTIAEAVTMAARIHSIYTTGTENFKQGDPWYQVYLNYAYQNGIISQDYYTCDVNQKATRAQFAEIFANAMDSNGLYPINSVADNAIPDVKMSASYADSVYKLYRAGILTGNDIMGTFSPGTFITRAEAATIVSRMAESNDRKSFTLS